MPIFGVIPIIKLQHDTESTIKQSKTMKSDMESKSTYLFWEVSYVQSLEKCWHKVKNVLRAVTSGHPNAHE